MTTPIAVPALPELPAYSQQDILDLFNRLLPSHYLEPLKDPGPGYELLQAYAAVAARISEAVAHVGNGSYIATATGGSYAEATIELYRENNTFGGAWLKAGTIVSTDDGYTYRTLNDVWFENSAYDLGPHPVTVRATVRSWLFNKPGQKTAADGSIIPGSINRITGPVLPDPPIIGYSFDPTIQVRQVTDAVGGAAPMLDGIGFDRGMPRFSGETDANYRVRLINLPDTVTPAAMQRQAENRLGELLAEAGTYYTINELWDLRVQTGYDHPMNVTVAPGEDVPYAPVCTTITDFTQNVFVWDYAPDTQQSTSGLAPSGYAVSNRWFEAADYRASIILSIPYNATFWPQYQALAQAYLQVLPAGARAYFVFHYD